ncbi:MAG: 2-oxo acid dehydrogenase subunit E2 [Oscillospiraceae bacterium]|nr:2-oxo acid dehydrogenase subunit E2 [Oscillospiraceae bacterium]
MFGKRVDGRTVGNNVDPITRVVPYIMTERMDAQCYCTQYFDSEIIDDYIHRKHREGHNISKMALILAAYVRAVSQYPEINRFVVGRTLYARKELCVSFCMLKINSATEFLETTVKVYFDPADTVYDVARKLDDTIERNRKLTTNNKTDKVANVLIGIPGLLSIGVGFLKWLDRIGLLPRSLVDASPFHTSMFITNMASIGMNHLHHHLYNFGTTTVFIGMGNKVNQVSVNTEGKMRVRKMYPLAVTTDERVCAGAVYSMAFKVIDKVLRNPELLETPPETVRHDCGVEIHCKEDKIH